MGVFLKTIGSGKNPCPEPYTKPYADFSHYPRQVDNHRTFQRMPVIRRITSTNFT